MDITMTEDDIDSPQAFYLSPEVWSMIGGFVRPNPSIEEAHLNFTAQLADGSLRYEVEIRSSR